MKNTLPKKNHKPGLPFFRTQLFLIVAFVVLCFVGGVYVYITHNYYKKEVTKQALAVAGSAQVFILPDTLNRLSVSEGDLTKPEYQKLKSSLLQFKKLNRHIEFAYIYTLKNDKIYFMVDSELEGSQGYSPPGQEYTEATQNTKIPFVNGEAVVSGAFTDRWGTWVSVLVPIKNSSTGQVIAVFGIDYPLSYWNAEIAKHTLHAVMIAVSLLLLFLVLISVYRKNRTLTEISKKLQYSEQLFKGVFEQAPIGISISSGDKVMSNVNPMFAKIVGRTTEEMLTLEWPQISYSDDVEEDLVNFEALQVGKTDGYTMNKRFVKPDGSLVWTNMIVAPLFFNDISRRQYLCLLQDITQSMETEQVLRESERSKSVLLANLPGMAYRCNYDKDWTMQFVSEGCFALTGYKPENLLYNRDLAFNKLISPEYQIILWNEWKRVLLQKKQFRYEYEIITATGEKKWVLELGQGVYDEQGNVKALEGIIIDVTTQKQREMQIKYLNERDFLTGLYNRRFFEGVKERLGKQEDLPVSIIIGDINGVKLVNDAFGHAEGDLMIKDAAQIMQRCCRKGDLVARTGGDEFAILLPHTNKETAFGILRKIKQECKEYNKASANKLYSLNISLGSATRESLAQTMRSVEKEAEDLMYTRKLLNRKSSHSSILASIMATMYARSQETEEHAKRLAVISKTIGRKLGLSQKELDALELFAMLHDIGKIGIDDRILNKRGTLNDAERQNMEKHPEIGYRIAMSSSELEFIAEYILYHHERWDGKGYPQGLKGEDIPLLARILAVADAYDAMTEDRVYRKALTKEAAIQEIKNHSGTQFDPKIVEVFMGSI